MAKKEEKLTHQLLELTNATRKLAKLIDDIESKQPFTTYAKPGRLLMFGFLNGLFIVLGSTVGVALVIYLLKWLGYLPILGNFFENVRAAITG